MSGKNRAPAPGPSDASRHNRWPLCSVAAALLCSLALTCVGCSSQPLSPRLTDTALGIVGGATMGAIVGAAAGGPLIGSIVGAGVGGVGGFLLGNQIATEQNQPSRQSQSQGPLGQPVELSAPGRGTPLPAGVQGASGS